MTGIGQIHINNFYSTGKMIIGGCFVWFFLEGRTAFLKYAFHLFLPSPMFYLEPSKKLTSSKTLCDDQCFTLSKTFGVILGAKHFVTTIVLLGALLALLLLLLSVLLLLTSTLCARLQDINVIKHRKNCECCPMSLLSVR